MPRTLKALAHFAIYAIGVGVLAASVVVTAVRLILPDVGIYRSEVEAWVGNYMGYPVAIRSLDADWQGWVPNLTLTNIDLLSQAGTKTLTHFKSAQISIDPWATILARHIVPKQLVVSGFDVSIVRMANGAIHIQGLELGAQADIVAGQSELAVWLFRQKHIRLVNGMVSWTDNLHGQEPVRLSNVTLTLRSDGSRLQVEGSTGLPQHYGRDMDFAFDATGDLLTSEWTGEFYLAANDINPDNWYRFRRPKAFNVAGGSADIRVWSRWSGARLASLQGQINYRDFVAHVGTAQLRVNRLAGGFSSTVQQNGQWRMGLRVNTLETEHGRWPETDMGIAADPGPGDGRAGYTVSFNYLRLDDVVPLVMALPQLDAPASAAWRRLQVRGELLNGTVAFGDQKFVYNLGFRDLGVAGAEKLPAFDSASGRLRGNLESARLQLHNDAISLAAGGSGGKGLALSGLQGTVEWARSDQGWRISSESLELHSPDASASVTGSVSRSDDSGKGLFVDVTAHAGPADAAAVIRHLPLPAEGRLLQWLNRAVVAGSMLSGDLVLRGHLEDFPFRNREGKFAALINAEDVTLDYSEKWPPIDALTGEIEFNGPELVVRAAGGRIFSATFDDATARIPDIRAAEKRLFITGSVAGSTGDLGLFVDQSPLSADPILTSVRNNLSGGDMNLKLALSLPLGGVGAPAEVNGTLALEGAQLRAGTAVAPLHQVTGSVDFTRFSATGTGIQAQFHDRSVALGISGDRAQSAGPPRIVVRGRGSDAFLRTRLDDFFPGLTEGQPEFFSRLRGESDWEVSMSFVDSDGDGRLNRRIAMHSDLAGMAVHLPAPLGKPADTAIGFTLTRDLDTPEPAPVMVRYGDGLSAVFGPRLAPGQPLSVALQFGPSEPDPDPAPAPGIHIGGFLDVLPASEWWDVLRELRAARSRQGTAQPLDISASGHVRQLLLLGREFHDVDVSATRAGENWAVGLRGAEIEGQVSIPDADGTSASIQADLTHLRLARGDDDGNNKGKTLDPRVIPPLRVSIGDLDFQGHALGAAEIVSSRVADGMQIDSATFTKPGLAITGAGTWFRQSEDNQSRFAVQVHADAIDDMLQTFGYNVAAVRKGETQLDIDAGWNGTPAEFSWAKLNGTLQMQVHKGQLLDVEPKAGRLFGLLSFQSLPRRLSLDFSDLFGKGMAFDRIEGSFNITDGNAYTNDLNLRGPSAEVTVAGRTGLAEQDYDQIVTVTPQVTGTLPVAGALFGPVGIGVGAVLYLADKMFDSARNSLDELLRYQYTITGSWDAPVIEKIDTKDKGSG
ncbi:MAG: TIGR02099 family protein [Gammaproteobacteria bacterium]|nr:TIGR02099 family protein [Gammaproteobacteria bacterium]